MASKKCLECQQMKPVSEFHRDSSNVDGLQRYCKACRKAHHQSVRRANAAAMRLRDRINNFRMKYGLTKEEATSWVLSGRQGVCECCGTQGALMFDHDHSTGKLRGKLCNHCNSLIGYAREDEEVLCRAINYLRKWK